MPGKDDAVRSILRWPARPPVLVGHIRYEIVSPAELRRILDEAEAFIFAQRALSTRQQELLFARVAAAAAVNALLDQ